MEREVNALKEQIRKSKQLQTYNEDSTRMLKSLEEEIDKKEQILNDQKNSFNKFKKNAEREYNALSEHYNRKKAELKTVTDDTTQAFANQNFIKQEIQQLKETKDFLEQENKTLRTELLKSRNELADLKEDIKGNKSIFESYEDVKLSIVPIKKYMWISLKDVREYKIGPYDKYCILDKYFKWDYLYKISQYINWNQFVSINLFNLFTKENSDKTMQFTSLLESAKQLRTLNLSYNYFIEDFIAELFDKLNHHMLECLILDNCNYDTNDNLTGIITRRILKTHLVHFSAEGTCLDYKVLNEFIEKLPKDISKLKHLNLCYEYENRLNKSAADKHKETYICVKFKNVRIKFYENKVPPSHECKFE